MKLEKSLVSFRNVLLQEKKETVTEGGILLPSTEWATDTYNKEYKVIKAGPDCTFVKEGDLVRLTNGVYPTKMDLSVDGKRQEFGIAYEQQITIAQRE